MTKKTAFIFDLDYTLIENNAFRYAYENIPKILDLSVSPEGFRDVFLGVYYELVKKGQLREAFNWDFVAEEAVKRLGASYRSNLFHQLFMEGIKNCLVKPRPNTIEVLNRIKGRGNMVIILTNGYRKYQLPVLRKVGLIEIVDALLTNDDLPMPKPSIESFHVAAEISRRLGASKMVYIGDHPFFDVYGALHAGMENIVWITDQYDEGYYDVKYLAQFIESYTYSRYHICIDLRRFWSKKILVIRRLDSLFRFID